MLFSLIVGLTGGIASGKSTVSGMLKERGFPIVDADLIARQVVEPGRPAYKKIIAAFGPEILLPLPSESADSLNDDVPDSSSRQTRPLDRAKLGQLVFGNDDNRRILNKCTHPYIIREIWWQIFKYAVLQGHKIVILDAPLLVETGLYKWMHANIVVYCPDQLQLERLLKRNTDLDEQAAQQRISAQIPMEEKKKLANVIIIDNSHDLSETKMQLLSVINDLEKQWKYSVIVRGSLLVLFVACPIVISAKLFM